MSVDMELVERMFCHGGAAVSAFDGLLRAAYWNPEMERLTDVPRDLALGAHADELFPSLVRLGGENCFERALSGSPTLGRPPFVGAADPVRGAHIDWFTTPLVVGGRVQGLVLVAHAMAGRDAPHDETEQRFRAMADSSPVLLWMSGLDSNCTFFNSTWLRFSGRSLDDELGIGWTKGVHPEDFERCMSTYTQAFSERASFEMEYRLRRHDGEYRWLLDRGAPRYDVGGTFVGFIGSCVDITDRIEAERATRALSQELGRANEYMQRLLYAASHDLREPVRMVTSYVGLLADHLEAAMDDEARRYVGYAVDGGARMSSLVDALLSLTRARSQPLVHQEVDLGEVLREVLVDLHIAIREAGADVEVGELPVVWADRALLVVVLMNLVSNGIKFRGEAPPKLTVTSKRAGMSWEIRVSDNGVGFAQADNERVFDMFTRLHPRQSYPGSGLGLALCREVIDRHGGRIWATSELGRGAAFAFTLPQRPEPTSQRG